MKTFAFTPEAFSIPAAAHYLSVSTRTVEEWIASGMLKTMRLRSTDVNSPEYLRKTLIRKRELDKFIDQGVTI